FVPAVPFVPAGPVVPPLPPEQVPFEQVWPAPQACPHVPQFAVVLTAVHADGGPHSIRPDGQPQVEFVQVAPAGQTVVQLPQWSESVARLTQDPPEHCMVPLAHELAHTLLLQTWVPVQVVVQLPQWLLSDDTH